MATDVIGPSHTILLVDDEADVLSALRRALRAEPYRVLTTTDPSEVLALVERERVDLIVSDVEMGATNGIELMSEVRRMFPGVVRVLLTGQTSLSQVINAINDGEVFRFLTKPWQNAELRETIAQALERRDELQRVAIADRAVVRRRELLAELEQEYPGISNVVKEDDVYVLNETTVEELVATIGDAERAALMDQ